MRRRSKDETTEPAEDQPAEASTTEESTEIDSRLAPLEDFRSKSDQWIKEASAQLARVDTHLQHDEKRQKRLEERLAEFEDRIQSMLTLTEALSLGDNPFVRPYESAPEQATTPPPRPAVADIPPDLGLSDEGSAPRSAWRDEEGEPLGQELVRLGVEEDASSSHQQPPQDEANATESSEPPREPPMSPPQKRAAMKGHPNDALFEDPLHGLEAEASYLPETHEPATPLDESPSLEANAAQEAEQRLLLLQWASLLARHMHRIDVDAFLETYLHTGWVSHTEVEKVRALAVDLARHAPSPTEKLTREDLHIRTILLLSRLSTRTERGARRALRLVEDARSIAHADWLPAER